MTIFVFLIVLGLLIFVHELGHFLVAKWNKVGVLEFAIGFGPILWRRTINGTTYALRAIPLGGFVRMVGDDPRMRDAEFTNPKPEEEEPPATAEEAITSPYAELTPEQLRMIDDRSYWFIEKGYFAKMAVVLAGPGFNIMFALLLSIGFFYFVGKPIQTPIAIPKIGDIMPGSPGERAGLRIGDVILEIDGKSLTKWEDIKSQVGGSQGKELTFLIERPVKSEDGSVQASEKVTLKITPELTVSEQVAILTGEAPPASYMIGVNQDSTMEIEPSAGISEAVQLGFAHVTYCAVLIKNFLVGLVRGIASPSNLGGPIEMFRQTQSSLDRGYVSFMLFVIFINVSLAIFNLLPVPVLDGGHLVFFTLEALKGSPLNSKIMDRANQVGLFLLLALMIFAFGNDIRRLWG